FGANEVHYQRVLLGGAGLLAVVLVRAVYVWCTMEPNQPAEQLSTACGHGDCWPGHYHLHFYEHQERIKPGPSLAMTSLPVAAHALPAAIGGRPAAGCSHEHDAGWAPTRFLFLGLPVFLFLLGLPSQGLSGGVEMKVSDEELGQVLGLTRDDRGGDDNETPFKQLMRAAGDRSARAELTGMRVRVTGMYVGEDTTRFTLMRYSVTCCAADAVPANVVVSIDPAARPLHALDPNKYRNKWVTVTGRLEFVFRRARNDYLPVLVLSP